MPNNINNDSKEHNTFKKKKNRKEQLQNVISLRINDDEKKTLEMLTNSTSKNVSDIMREAIALWSTKKRTICMD